jgi:hypothetical protein
VKGSTCSSASSLLLLLLSSSSYSLTGGKRWAAPGDSGDERGGDCTRTFLTTFGFWKLVVGGGWFELERACNWCRNESAGGRAGAGPGGGFGVSSTSAKRGTAAGEAAGAEGAGALRRNGLLELRGGCCAMAANNRTSEGTGRNGCLGRVHAFAIECSSWKLEARNPLPSGVCWTPAPHPTRPLLGL